MSKNMSTNANAQLPVADYYIGCDVAKAKLDVSLINAQSQEQWADTFANEEVAIATFLLSLRGAYPDQKLQVVTEDTGTYHYALAETSHAVVKLPLLRTLCLFSDERSGVSRWAHT